MMQNILFWLILIGGLAGVAWMYYPKLLEERDKITRGKK